MRLNTSKTILAYQLIAICNSSSEKMPKTINFNSCPDRDSKLKISYCMQLHALHTKALNDHWFSWENFKLNLTRVCVIKLSVEPAIYNSFFVSIQPLVSIPGSFSFSNPSNDPQGNDMHFRTLRSVGIRKVCRPVDYRKNK